MACTTVLHTEDIGRSMRWKDLGRVGRPLDVLLRNTTISVSDLRAITISRFIELSALDWTIRPQESTMMSKFSKPTW